MPPSSWILVASFAGLFAGLAPVARGLEADPVDIAHPDTGLGPS